MQQRIERLDATNVTMGQLPTVQLTGGHGSLKFGNTLFNEIKTAGCRSRLPQKMYKNDGCLVVSRGKPNHGLNIRCAEFASGTREAKSSPISQLLRESAVTLHSVTAL